MNEQEFVIEGGGIKRLELEEKVKPSKFHRFEHFHERLIFLAKFRRKATGKICSIMSHNYESLVGTNHYYVIYTLCNQVL